MASPIPEQDPVPPVHWPTELRALMHAQGMRGVDLARAVGLAPTTISAYLRSKSAPSPRSVAGLIRALDPPAAQGAAWHQDAATRTRACWSWDAAERREATRARHRAVGVRGGVRHCQRCRRQFLYFPSNPDAKYCSLACKRLAQMQSLEPTGAFARFVYQQWLEAEPHLQALTAYAAYLGISRTTLRDLLKEKCIPNECTWQQLRRVLGAGLPAITTATELRRERGRVAIEAARPKPGTRKYREMLKKINAPRPATCIGCGQDMGPVHPQRRYCATRCQRRANRQRRQAQDGPPQPSSDAQATWWASGLPSLGRTPQGRAIRALGGRLRYTPSPTLAQVHDWAGLVAGRLGLPVSAVWACWQPTLRRRGLVPLGGVSPLVRRCRLVRRLEAVGTSLRDIAAAVAVDEYGRLPDAEDQERWFETFKRWRQRHYPCRCDLVAAEGATDPP
jgi:transcriptional regulator with XRE-family HTH domain